MKLSAKRARKCKKGMESKGQTSNVNKVFECTVKYFYLRIILSTVNFKISYTPVRNSTRPVWLSSTNYSAIEDCMSFTFDWDRELHDCLFSSFKRLLAVFRNDWKTNISNILEVESVMFLCNDMAQFECHKGHNLNFSSLFQTPYCLKSQA